mmetsp:Transcript_55270/g.63204  ORF Transcript_55270/g.63204 Transcript_55270/m.63204 type:complete len:154 (+) Transcript_55270:67-528(+)
MSQPHRYDHPNKTNTRETPPPDTSLTTYQQFKYLTLCIITTISLAYATHFLLNIKQLYQDRPNQYIMLTETNTTNTGYVFSSQLSPGNHTHCQLFENGQNTLKTAKNSLKTAKTDMSIWLHCLTGWVILRGVGDFGVCAGIVLWSVWRGYERV